MQTTFPRSSRCLRVLVLLTTALFVAPATPGQDKLLTGGKDLYNQIKPFQLSGGSVAVKELTLAQDRVRMMFDGTFYFTAPVDGRESLRVPPMTRNGGVGKGRLVDVGPIILGHRLDTSKTRGAYQTLIYDKGALVLRMLHFLLTDPASGKGDGFFEMMKDFVNRYHDQFASTDDFREVANEHFAKSPIARIYHLNNLDWFFKEWVYQSDLPSYQMEYKLQDQPDGKVILSGTVTQENAPKDWFRVLPIVITFGGKQAANATVHAYGPSATFQLKLPMRPTKVELDPNHWIISEKTSTKGN